MRPEDLELTATDYRVALAGFLSRPLAIWPAYLQRLLAVGAMPSIQGAAAATARGPLKSQGGTAVIPIVGPIDHRNSMFAQFFGLPTSEGIGSALRSALADDAVKSIVFDIDSPGGVVDGIEELAAEIHAARGQKPMTSVANSWAASAAYYVGTQADELVVTPSGEVGSVGVVTFHADWSRYYDALGITPTVLTAGKYKAETNPYQPLTTDAAEHIQTELDGYYDMFINAVARGRGVSASDVRSGFGQGRMVMAREAVRLGMADRIATLDQVLGRHGGADNARRVRGEDGTPPITSLEDPSSEQKPVSTEALYALVRTR